MRPRSASARAMRTPRRPSRTRCGTLRTAWLAGTLLPAPRGPRRQRAGRVQDLRRERGLPLAGQRRARGPARARRARIAARRRRWCRSSGCRCAGKDGGKRGAAGARRNGGDAARALRRAAARRAAAVRDARCRRAPPGRDGVRAPALARGRRRDGQDRHARGARGPLVPRAAAGSASPRAPARRTTGRTPRGCSPAWRR